MSARARLAALTPLLAQLEALKEGRDGARALAHELLEAHREGLAQMLVVLRGNAQGEALLHQCCADPDIAALLMLHGLHPVPLEQRVRTAVDALAGRLAAQRATLRLAKIGEDGHVDLTLEHAGKAGSLHGEIEEALALAAADAEVRIHESVAVPVSLSRLKRKAGA